ncbi:helix-turn-helix transcriptional regulator [Pseudonocardia sp. NPDC049635]|uniref:helix-turn-helix domain-containing protein n=1 Tax=Pseudonocardia sp. NPDC049635 TaxID=3155506 RepID=UPI0033DF957D
MTSAVETLTLRERVAADVRSWMIRRGISGQDLADHLNVSPAYVSRRLKGRTAFDVDDLDRIATFLGVPLGIHLGGRPGDAPRPPEGAQQDAGRGAITLARSAASALRQRRFWLVGAAGADHIPVAPGYGSCVPQLAHAATPRTRTDAVGESNYARAA